jgi:hypothetical protein
MPKKRFTEEERKQRLREAVKRYRLAHPERVQEQRRRWRERNVDAEYRKQQAEKRMQIRHANPEEARAKVRLDYHKHRDERLVRMRQYRLDNLARLTAKKKEYYAANREVILERRKLEKFKPYYKEMRRRNSKAQQDRLREQMIAAYGGKCACCGEDKPEFMTLDHTDLCMNCNWAMGLRGYCPHQQVGGATFAIGVAA